MSRSKSLAQVSKQCVACGCCVKCCRSGAISVYKGMYAVVDSKKCVGCGKCAATCPACVITLKPMGVKLNEKALV